MTIPEFVKDNPYVDILAQRGKEPPDTYLEKSPKKPQKQSKTVQRTAESTQEQPTPTPPLKTAPLKSTKSIILFNRRLIDAIVKKQITVPQANAISYALANQIRVICPPKPIEVNQQVTVTPNQKKLVEQLKEDEQAVLIRAIKRLESAGPSSS